MARKVVRYNDPDNSGKTHTRTDVRKLAKARQLKVMRRWFFENYEDPANSVPYCSAEGGYLWASGYGPFSASDALQSEFSGLVKDEVIFSLAGELDNICWDWAYTSKKLQELGFYDDADAALDPNVPEDALYIRLENLTKLLAEVKKLPADQQQFQLMMIFSFCITTLECFLSGTFTKVVLNDEAKKAKYLSENRTLKEQKISLPELHKLGDGVMTRISDHIKGTITDTTFHNLKIVPALYKKVLDVDFDIKKIGGVGDLIPLVEKRHHFVHRGGIDKDGNLVTTDVAEVKKLLNRIRKMCKAIHAVLNKPQKTSSVKLPF